MNQKSVIDRQTHIKAMISVAIAAILWSTAGLFIKWVQWPPVAIAGIRSGIAGLVIFIYWLATYKKMPPLPTPQKAFGALNYAALVLLFVFSNKLTTAANAILLQFSAPVWVMILGAIFLKEPIRKKDTVTVLCVFAGMGLFFLGDLGSGSALGNGLAILSGVAMAIMVISLKGVKTGSPLEIVLWGNVVTFLIGIPFYGQISLDQMSLIGIGLLGVFQLGTAYIFYAKGIQNVTALDGILLTVLEPLLNPVWVFLFNGERPTLFALIGGAVVVISVSLHSLKSEMLH